MAFELPEGDKKTLRQRQKESKGNREVIEHIKISVFLFLNAKVTMSLISQAVGIDIVTVGKYGKKYKAANNLKDVSYPLR